ncbi:hypothetical protein H1S01_16580 [Heliobacterium chlorum]|uniref:Uncharacterized protein n=1 Tax=Heliobacterium chlorum TaxID=2698 RepID=A0ABR7T794_HELCL|nr:hypothetical protein [Heliobacterium chlorum]MBC9786087.1 hypothetical protein [Heliobacterium chlorum]
MLYCKRCGWKPMEGWEIICGKCGARLTEGEPSEDTPKALKEDTPKSESNSTDDLGKGPSKTSEATETAKSDTVKTKSDTKQDAGKPDKGKVEASSSKGSSAQTEISATVDEPIILKSNEKAAAKGTKGPASEKKKGGKWKIVVSVIVAGALFGGGGAYWWINYSKQVLAESDYFRQMQQVLADIDGVNGGLIQSLNDVPLKNDGKLNEDQISQLEKKLDEAKDKHGSMQAPQKYIGEQDTINEVIALEKNLISQVEEAWKTLFKAKNTYQELQQKVEVLRGISDVDIHNNLNQIGSRISGVFDVQRPPVTLKSIAQQVAEGAKNSEGKSPEPGSSEAKPAEPSGNGNNAAGNNGGNAAALDPKTFFASMDSLVAQYDTAKANLSKSFNEFNYGRLDWTGLSNAVAEGKKVRLALQAQIEALPTPQEYQPLKYELLGALNQAIQYCDAVQEAANLALKGSDNDSRAKMTEAQQLNGCIQKFYNQFLKDYNAKKAGG